MPPLGIAIAAFIYTVGIPVAFANFALATLGSMLISAGLQYVVNAIRGGGDGQADGRKTVTGVSFQIQTGGIVPRSFIVGLYATAGKLEHAGSWGSDGDTPLAYLTHVISLSDLPINALTGLWVNDVEATYNTGLTAITQGYPIVEYRVDGKDHLWVKFYDGSQIAAAPFLTTTFGADPTYPYTSAKIGTGVAYVIVTMLYNPQLFSGRPTFKFEVEGVKLYDQRLDTTAGGSGAHRFADQTTWAFTKNPAVIINNILRGMTYGGAWFYGPQNTTVESVPSASWFAAMNECDTDVTNSAAGTEDQFRCGAEISVDMQPADVIDALLMSCNGRLAEVGGIYKINVGASGSSIYSFTDSDIIISQPQTHEQFPSLGTLINGISATYPEPAEAWNTRDAPPINDTDLEDEDGGRQLMANINYAAVPYSDQVQRLMSSALLEARKFRRHTLCLPPSAWKLEPNDVVTWTSTRNGYISKLFRVDAVIDGDNLEIGVAISEVDPADYDFDAGTDYQAITVPIQAEPVLPDATTAPTGFAAYQAGSTVTFVWDLMVNYGFTGYDLLMVAQGGSIGSAVYIAKDIHTNYAAFSNIAVGSYTFFLVGRDTLDIPGEAARGAAVSINFTVSALGSGAIADYFLLLRRLESLFDLYAEIDIAQSYTEAITLPASISGVSASVSTESTIRANADSVLAEQILTVQAQADDATASGIFRIVAVAGPAGTAAQADLEVRAAVGEDYEVAVVSLAAMTGGGSLFRVQADFIELDGTILNDGALLTDMLAPNSVTILTTSVTAGPITSTTSYQEIGTLTYTSSGATTIILVSSDIENIDGGNHDADIKLVNETTAETLYEQLKYSCTGGKIMVYGTHEVDVPPAGSVNYKLYFKSDGTNLKARRNILTPLEVKR